MVLWLPRRLPERIAIGDAEISPVHIPERRKSFDGLPQAIAGRQQNINVNHRLGRKPGTAVLPTCSIAAATSPSAPAMRSRKASNSSGHFGS